MVPHHLRHPGRLHHAVLRIRGELRQGCHTNKEMAADDSPSVPSGRAPRAPGERSLWQVRAAQLRARATRQAIVQVLLGSVFLVGALAYARAPDHHAQSSLAWMAGLLVLSTFDVAVGLRTLARLRLRRRSQGLWIAATAAWGLLATALVGFLLRS